MSSSPKRRRFSDMVTKRPIATAKNSAKTLPSADIHRLDVQSLSESLSESVFPRLSPLESSQILNEVMAGYKQLKKLRRLPKSPKHQSPPLPGSLNSIPEGGTSLNDPRASPPSSSSDSEDIKRITEIVPKRCPSPETKKASPDTHIRLTLRNVTTICEVLLRQREDKIREEYDTVLQQKLSEQYEMFCRYSQDQLRQHKPSSSSSYIS